MEIDAETILNSNFKIKSNNLKYSKIICNKYIVNYIKIIFLVFIIIFCIIIIFFYNIFQIKKNYFFIEKKIIQNAIKISNLKSKFENLKNLIININKEKNPNIFNKINIFEDDIQEQNNYCNNPTIFSNLEFDKKIMITNAEFNNKKFNMYVYKNGDFVSENIINLNNWESNSTNNILNALNYYSIKKNINKKNIYIIDIGAHVGWYTFTLSKFGFKIISFEPSKLNYYILKKNYCINKELNVILINKGLYNEDKICDLYYFKTNIGDAIVKCDNNPFFRDDIINDGEIILTKLNNYLPFIKEKNLLLIKIDVEGSEGKVFEGGDELITKYHVPFIFMEFTQSLLKLQGTDSKKFLQIFVNNGYKISPFDFFDPKNYTLDYIINSYIEQKNLYITYSKIFEN